MTRHELRLIYFLESMNKTLSVSHETHVVSRSIEGKRSGFFVHRLHLEVADQRTKWCAIGANIKVEVVVGNVRPQRCRRVPIITQVMDFAVRVSNETIEVHILVHIDAERLRISYARVVRVTKKALSCFGEDSTFDWTVLFIARARP
jgi:hypothetical protein